MAPVRRYLRINQYSILEVRIHLDTPADRNRWLLHPANPALPRIIEAVQPLVLPKLQEAKGRDGKKGKNKDLIGDTVIRDDFDVSVYFRDLITPHSVMQRHKTFAHKEAVGGHDGTQDAPVNVADDDDASEESPAIRREDSDEADVVKLEDVPAFDGPSDPARNSPEITAVASDGEEAPGVRSPDALEGDDKKKLGFTARYEGFRVEDKVLTLLVTRKHHKGREADGAGGGHAMMQDWIASTQGADASRLDD